MGEVPIFVVLTEHFTEPSLQVIFHSAMDQYPSG
jgi:hypothetical protein